MKPNQKDPTWSVKGQTDRFGRRSVSFSQTPEERSAQESSVRRTFFYRRSTVLRLRVNSAPEDITAFEPVIRFR